jgi:pimeloyl-ACP methyl ester carboxylesterase
MVTFLIVFAILVLAFLFFSRPRTKLTNPSADIETQMGRTTIYHYRSKLPQGKGVIAMVHGFCENQLYFQRVARPLTKAGYDCIAINLFGYNGSLPNQENCYTVQAYAQQVHEALQELERLRFIKKLVAVWGHSMGATAVYLASNDIVTSHPEVQGIFLENPGFGSVFSLLSRVLKPSAFLANFAGARRLLQPFVNLLFARKIKDADAKQFMKHLLIDYAPKKSVAVANLNSLSKLDFSLENISENALRKLYFIFSQKDKLISLRKVQNLIIRKLRENSIFGEQQLLIIRRVDHFISLQAPDEIADFVLKQMQAEQTMGQSNAVHYK